MLDPSQLRNVTDTVRVITREQYIIAADNTRDSAAVAIFLLNNYELGFERVFATRRNFYVRTNGYALTDSLMPQADGYRVCPVRPGHASERPIYIRHLDE